MNSMMSRISPSAANMIRMDHTHVLASFHQYSPDSRPQTRKALANSICLALEIHAQLEEELFYPALRGSRTQWFAGHSMIVVAGLLACNQAASAAAGQVSCL